MKNAGLIVGLLLGLIWFAPAQAQVEFDSIAVPAAGVKAKVCKDIDRETSPTYFIDYSDLDGDVYLKMGPDPGDGGYAIWKFSVDGGETLQDSLLLDNSVVTNTTGGTQYKRLGVTKDAFFKRFCWEIYNVDASTDSTLMIYRK